MSKDNLQIGLHLLPGDRVSLMVTVVYTGLASLRASGNSPTYAPNLTV